MHHPIEESPEQDISEKTSNKAPSEEQPPWFKEFVPSSSSLKNEQEGEEKRREEIKNEAVQSSQPQDASCCSGQCGDRSAAVVQHSSVAPHSYFTDELWTLPLGYNSCHLGSGRQSQVGAAVSGGIQTHLLTQKAIIIINLNLWNTYHYASSTSMLHLQKVRKISRCVYLTWSYEDKFPLSQVL